MRISETYYRKNLPHLHPLGYCFFITATLEGAVPRTKITRLKREYKEKAFHLRQMAKDEVRTELIRNHQWQYFKEVDELMDKINDGPHWLKNKSIAQMLADQFHRFDGIYYDLLAYTIMSNHFHLVIDTRMQIREDREGKLMSVDRILKRIKGASACYANRILNRTGQFWRRESYDRYIRDHKMLNNVINYVLENPVKAGIVSEWEDYPHSYLAILK